MIAVALFIMKPPESHYTLFNDEEFFRESTKVGFLLEAIQGSWVHL